MIRAKFVLGSRVQLVLTKQRGLVVGIEPGGWEPVPNRLGHSRRAKRKYEVAWDNGTCSAHEGTKLMVESPKRKIRIIAAVDKSGVIGKGNTIPWKVPSDMKIFRLMTTGHPIIMGRRTFESIGRPLPNRQNIVVTSREAYIEGIQTARTLHDAIALAGDAKQIWIIGGARLYEEAIGVADEICLTRLDLEVEPADDLIRFPEIDDTEWVPDNGRLVPVDPKEVEEEASRGWRSTRTSWSYRDGNRQDVGQFFVYRRRLVTGELNLHAMEQLRNALSNITYDEFHAVLKESIDADESYARSCWVSFRDNMFGYLLSRNPMWQSECILAFALRKAGRK